MAAASTIPKGIIDTAITTLLNYSAHQSLHEDLQIYPNDNHVYLICSPFETLDFNKFPLRIPLLHPIFDSRGKICIVIEQWCKNSENQIQESLTYENIPIPKVVRIGEFNIKCKNRQSKSSIVDSYELIFVDKNVDDLLPEVFREEGSRKEKTYYVVNVKKNLKLQVEKCLGSSLLYLRELDEKDFCCAIRVGKVNMEKNKIMQNVVDAIEKVVDNIPNKWSGVKTLHLKLTGMIPLPIFAGKDERKNEVCSLGFRGVRIESDDEDIRDGGSCIAEKLGSSDALNLKKHVKKKKLKSGKNECKKVNDNMFASVENVNNKIVNVEIEKADVLEIGSAAPIGKKRKCEISMKDAIYPGEIDVEKDMKKKKKKNKVKSYEIGDNKIKKNWLAGGEEVPSAQKEKDEIADIEEVAMQKIEVSGVVIGESAGKEMKRNTEVDHDLNVVKRVKKSKKGRAMLEVRKDMKKKKKKKVKSDESYMR